MTLTSAYLADGDRTMVLYPRENLHLLQITPGSPTVRPVVEPRVDGPGTIDTTRLFGARQIAIDLFATATPAAFQDELAGFCDPADRPYLVLDDDAWADGPRRIQLRSDAWTGPLDAEQDPDHRYMQAQWQAPTGAWEAAEEVTLTVSADVPSSVGMSFPMSFPMSFAATTATGVLSATNPGTTAADYVARLYGPITAPRLINTTLGEELTFDSGLVLASGEYVEVSTRGITAYRDGLVDQDLLEHLDWDASTWWLLPRGNQLLRFTGVGPTAGARAVIYYRPLWL